MQNLLWALTGLASLLGKFKKILPEMFVIIFSIITAVVEGFRNGFKAGVMVLAKEIFGAELVIRQNVQLAIQNDPTYSFFAFFAILNGVLVIYVLTKFIMKYIIMGISGSTAPVSAFLISLLIVGLIEMAAIGWIEHIFFIPLWDGVIFLLFNLQPVFGNIHWFSNYVPTKPIINENTTITATKIENITS